MRRALPVAVVVLLALGFVALPAAAAMDKVDVCHVTNTPEPGDGHVISIADAAYPTHANHGDAKVGEGAVAEDDGWTCHLVTLDAVDDEVTTPVDTPVTIDVLANDAYVGSVVVSLQSGPSSGVVDPWVDGTITYYPDPGFFGTDSFTYRICDASSQCDTATVIIIVGP